MGPWISAFVYLTLLAIITDLANVCASERSENEKPTFLPHIFTHLNHLNLIWLIQEEGGNLAKRKNKTKEKVCLICMNFPKTFTHNFSSLKCDEKGYMHTNNHKCPI